MVSRYFTARSFTVPLAGTVLFALDRLVLSGNAPGLTAVSHLTLWAGYCMLTLGLLLAGAVPAGLWAWLKRYDRPALAWIPGLLLGLLCVPGLYLMSADLVRGDWISRQRFAPVLRYGVIAAGVVAFTLIGRLHWGQAKSPGRRTLLLPRVLLALALLLTVVNAVVLPGLYLLVHLGLSFATAILLVLATTRLLDTFIADSPSRALRAGAVAAALLSAGAAAAGVALLGRAQGGMLMGSPVAAQILPVLHPSTLSTVEEELASMDVRHSGAAEETPKDPQAVSKFLEGKRDWNILWVIVDTLRADTLPPWRRPGQEHAQDGDTPFMDSWVPGTYRFRASYSQASRTRRSLPPTFRSVEAHEDPEHTGISLGEQIPKLGLTPIAIIPQYFFQPHAEQAQGLLAGFDHATVYEKDKAQNLIDLVKDTLEGTKGQRFFAWLHFYNMHDPFADRPLTAADGSPAQRYRMALKWLDGQMQRLDAVLKQTGLDQSTVIIFTADHGENLGGPDGRVGHGETARQVEIKVPLYIRVPGKSGGVIDRVAGNVDILPTSFDFLGLPPSPNHRGKSLLPYLAGAAPKDEVPLYIESGSGSDVSVVIGDHKLVYSKKGQYFHHFNVANDPRETTELYNNQNPIDRDLLRAMLRKNPQLFAAELGSAQVRDLLIARLREVDEKTPAGEKLDLLLSLAALSQNKEALAEGERIFQKPASLAVELLTVRRLFKSDAGRWSKLVGKRLEKSFGTAEEGPFVDGLARQGQGELDHGLISKRLSAMVKSYKPEDWLPYLSLIAAWRKPAQFYLGPVKGMFEVVSATPLEGQSTEVLSELLEVATTLTFERNNKGVEELLPYLRPCMFHPHPAVAVKAIRFVAKVEDQDSAVTMESLLDTPGLDVRISNALLNGVADLEGKPAADVIMYHATRSPLLTVESVRILGRLGNPEALPWLRETQKNHYNQFTRQEAKNAIGKIEKGNARKPTVR